MLRLAPALTLALLTAPIAAGLVGTILPAFGILPALGRSEFTLDPWRELFAAPGLATSLRLTLAAGFGTTLASLALALGFCALVAERPFFARAQRALAPLLAIPHVAIAIGFAFLIAPSGWIVRLISPELTGWDRPPDLPIVRDPLGLSFALGLVLKEVPYLVLMILGAMGQVAAGAQLNAAATLGYARPTAWAKVVLPQIYPLIRLPVYAVLAFSLSVVEVALILAPGNPPPLSVVAARWFASYDLQRYFPAAAAAILQLAIVLAAIALWRLGERVAGSLGGRWIEGGGRRGAAPALVTAAGWLAVATGVASFVGIAGLVLWSLAETWRFPNALPERWSLAAWMRLGDGAAPLATTVLVGLLASLVALALSLACLENEQRRSVRPGARALWLLYLPLLVPQIAFLFGVQVILVQIDLDATLTAVAWTHLLFVLPYVFLSLADPYRSLDRRYAQIAAGLGVPPWRTFWRVKVPLLLRPILIAFAIGFAVSVSLYLPTVFAGAGRISTLTTEAVTLSGGADRRLVGVTALLQSVLPLGVYALALIAASAFRSTRRSRA